MGRTAPRRHRLMLGTLAGLLSLVLGCLPTRPAVAAWGLPVRTAGPMWLELAPADRDASVEVRRVTLRVHLRTDSPRLALLPPRVTAAIEARYVLRWMGEADRSRGVSLRFLGTPSTTAHLDGRPVELYPASEGTGRLAGSPEVDQPASGGPAQDGLMTPLLPADSTWVDPFDGSIYRAGVASSIGGGRALGVDVTLQGAQDHELRLLLGDVAPGWDGSRYLAPVYHVALGLEPEAWASFGPVEVHAGLPDGFAGAVAGDGEAGGVGGWRAYGFHRWTSPPEEVRFGAVSTQGMWFGWVTRRRGLLWLLAATWLLFVLGRAWTWRIARRRDGWSWASLPLFVVLPWAACWISWQAVRVPLWGYPFSLFQYAVWGGLAAYAVGRPAADLLLFSVGRWRQARRTRKSAPQGPRGDAAPAPPVGRLDVPSRGT